MQVKIDLDALQPPTSEWIDQMRERAAALERRAADLEVLIVRGGWALAFLIRAGVKGSIALAKRRG